MHVCVFISVTRIIGSVRRFFPTSVSRYTLVKVYRPLSFLAFYVSLNGRGRHPASARVTYSRGHLLVDALHTCYTNAIQLANVAVLTI